MPSSFFAARQQWRGDLTKPLASAGGVPRRKGKTGGIQIRLAAQRQHPEYHDVKLGCHLAVCLALTANAHVVATQLLPRNVALTLRKIDVATGKEAWSTAIGSDLDPWSVELFDERVVVYCSKAVRQTIPGGKGPPTSEVLFFDSNSGAKAAAFYTRDFVRTREDRLRARSSMTTGPALDVRNEVRLANGWLSHGLARMNWDGNRAIHFFQEEGLGTNDRSTRDWPIRWTFAFPDGAFSEGVAAWGDNLLYRRHVMEGTVRVAILAAVPAGSQRSAWEFRLPKEIPDVIYAEVLHPEWPHPSRVFEYSVGRSELLVFGSGFLFGLDPASGVVRWRQDVANSDGIKRRRTSFLHGYAWEASAAGDVVCATDRLQPPNVLAATKRGRGEVRVLREDLNESRLVVVFEGFIYCLTEVLMPEDKNGPRASPL